MNAKNTVIAGLTVALVGALGAIGYLTHQLNEMRAAPVHAASSNPAEATARVAAATAALPRPKPALIAPTAKASGAVNATKATAAKSTSAFEAHDAVDFAGKMLDDPKTAALFQSELASRIEGRYAPFVDKLNLTAEQKKQLLGLLVEREMATLDAMRMLHDRPGVSVKEQADTLLAVRNDADQPIQALLGPQFDELKSFDKTVPYRMEADHITSGVALGEEPLSTAQREKLVQGLIDSGRVSPAAFARNGVFDRDAYLLAISDRNNAVLNSMKETLSPTQYTALNHYFEAQRTKTALATAKYAKK
jgi:hypothetical protein